VLTAVVLSTAEGDNIRQTKRKDLRSLGAEMSPEYKEIPPVTWSFLDNGGMLRTLKLPAYWVPQASIPTLLQQYPNEIHGRVCSILVGLKDFVGIQLEKTWDASSGTPTYETQ
jgi:hypothetical protein